ncbi:uncharacterized protein LY89DRAFT_783756 [Mollisia scopiformis]|uniref:2EXR domain-containing protein n=1 Tax=Mollisia scopiformis TaxID=149040 RepID=A0A194X393_MOLSC|nr:uncharacterized protein LY89DRAFT_783756 [Mollisia scopiformis]KUJ14658.1 hypothetical protein LY89DRAFT_783756 [Mollisia scopiformis]
MEASKPSLEALRMREVEKIAATIAAEAHQFGLEPRGVSEDSLRAVLESTQSLLNKLKTWTSSSSTSIELGDFHYFQNLPDELKVLIWKFSLPSARILPVQHHIDHDRYAKDRSDQELEPGEPAALELFLEYQKDPSKYMTTVLRHEQSSILWVCRQSREEALKVFSLRLDTTKTTCGFRIDPGFDTLYFQYSNRRNHDMHFKFETGQLWQSIALSAIQHLAFDTKRLTNILDVELGNPFRRLGALKDITVVCHSTGCRLHDRELAYRSIHLEVLVENSPPFPVIGSYEQIQRLRDRFSVCRATKPDWHVPSIILKTARMEGSSKICCEMTWKELQAVIGM